MTEDQAKTKWCPYARWFAYKALGGPYGVGAGVNRSETSSLCLASKCMQWRLFDEWQSDKGGYCGLAGKEGTL